MVVEIEWVALVVVQVVMVILAGDCGDSCWQWWLSRWWYWC